MTHYKKLYRECWNDWKLMDMDGNFFISCHKCNCRIYEDNVTVNNFSHIKGKNTEPGLRYDKSNVVPSCFSCHTEHHTGGKVNNFTGIR